MSKSIHVTKLSNIIAAEAKLRCFRDGSELLVLVFGCMQNSDVQHDKKLSLSFKIKLRSAALKLAHKMLIMLLFSSGIRKVSLMNYHYKIPVVHFS